MGDVTFGVKVSEEMKNELSGLMKEHTLSGKEFMSMLLASYKLDQAKNESQLFESDLAELQQLIKRIASIFLNMTEKSKLAYKEEESALQKVIEAQKSEKESLFEALEVLKNKLEDAKKKESEWQAQIKEKEELIEKRTKERDLQKAQLENNILLHQKFEEEVERLKEEIESYKRLELEISERNDENTKLKNRNDEMASENWFLQREVEKITKEKEQLIEKYELEKNNMTMQAELSLKNALLQQQLTANETIQALREEIMRLKEAHIVLKQEQPELKDK